MLVINDTTTSTHSESRVAYWLRGWTGAYFMSGVAIANYRIPNLHTSRSQQADFIILTPQTVTVVEVKGTHPTLTSGVLTAEDNGPWHHSESDVEPVHTLERDTNPINQVLRAAFLFKALAGKHNPGAFVGAVVAIVPPYRSTLTLRVDAMPTGCDVVLGNKGLRAHFHKTGHEPPVWTAEQAYSLLNAMNLGHLLTIADLTSEGFPTLDAVTSTWTPPPQATASTPRPGRARRSVPLRTRHDRPVTEFSPTSATRRISVSPNKSHAAVASTPRHVRSTPSRGHRLQQAAAILVIAAVAAATWWLVDHFNPAPVPTPIPDKPTHSTIHNPVAIPGSDTATR
ncbi:nuclease-related domain-containing protein [Nocardia sp. NPDC052278]|uniref:nuclease-related domain-containing protein n=1 Tax=unclassified Nocardia TaxID=2637762 RepID=UPI00368E36E8